MDVLQRLNEMQRENKELCCLQSSNKTELKEYVETWAAESAQEMKDYKYAIQACLDEVNQKVDELSDYLETLKIIRPDARVGGKNEDKAAMFVTFQARCYNCGKLENDHELICNKFDLLCYRCHAADVCPYSDQDVARFSRGENQREIRKRKSSDEITEVDEKKQKFDRRKGESCIRGEGRYGAEKMEKLLFPEAVLI